MGEDVARSIALTLAPIYRQSKHDTLTWTMPFLAMILVHP